VTQDMQDPSGQQQQQLGACFEFSTGGGGGPPEGYGCVQQGKVLFGPRLTRCAGVHLTVD